MGGAIDLTSVCEMLLLADSLKNSVGLPSACAAEQRGISLIARLM
jgi:hypothetical protein